MIPIEQIRSFVDDVVRQFHPRKVILFGSYAAGHPTEDSDVDLLVILPHRSTGPEIASRIRMACPRSFAMDLLVRTPGEIDDRLNKGDQFIRDVVSQGVVLHESDYARMGR